MTASTRQTQQRAASRFSASASSAPRAQKSTRKGKGKAQPCYDPDPDVDDGESSDSIESPGEEWSPKKDIIKIEQKWGRTGGEQRGRERSGSGRERRSTSSLKRQKVSRVPSRRKVRVKEEKESQDSSESSGSDDPLLLKGPISREYSSNPVDRKVASTRVGPTTYSRKDGHRRTRQPVETDTEDEEEEEKHAEETQVDPEPVEPIASEPESSDDDEAVKEESTPILPARQVRTRRPPQRYAPEDQVGGKCMKPRKEKSGEDQVSKGLGSAIARSKHATTMGPLDIKVESPTPEPTSDQADSDEVVVATLNGVPDHSVNHDVEPTADDRVIRSPAKIPALPMPKSAMKRTNSSTTADTEDDPQPRKKAKTVTINVRKNRIKIITPSTSSETRTAVQRRPRKGKGKKAVPPIKRRQSNWNEKQAKTRAIKDRLASAVYTYDPSLAITHLPPQPATISTSSDIDRHPDFQLSSDSDRSQDGLPSPLQSQEVSRTKGLDLLCVAAQMVQLNLVPPTYNSTPRLPVSSDPRTAPPLSPIHRRPPVKSTYEDLEAMRDHGDHHWDRFLALADCAVDRWDEREQGSLASVLVIRPSATAVEGTLNKGLAQLDNRDRIPRPDLDFEESCRRLYKEQVQPMPTNEAILALEEALRERKILRPAQKRNH